MRDIIYHIIIFLLFSTWKQNLGINTVDYIDNSFLWAERGHLSSRFSSHQSVTVWSRSALHSIGFSCTDFIFLYWSFFTDEEKQVKKVKSFRQSLICFRLHLSSPLLLLLRTKTTLFLSKFFTHSYRNLRNNTPLYLFFLPHHLLAMQFGQLLTHLDTTQQMINNSLKDNNTLLTQVGSSPSIIFIESGGYACLSQCWFTQKDSKQWNSCYVNVNTGTNLFL